GSAAGWVGSSPGVAPNVTTPAAGAVPAAAPSGSRRWPPARRSTRVANNGKSPASSSSTLWRSRSSRRGGPRRTSDAGVSPHSAAGSAAGPRSGQHGRWHALAPHADGEGRGVGTDVTAGQRPTVHDEAHPARVDAHQNAIEGGLEERPEVAAQRALEKARVD